MREPITATAGSRGRIPTEPPTAVGLTEGPEWHFPAAPRLSWWARFCQAIRGWFAGSKLGYYSDYGYYSHYDGRPPLGIPLGPAPNIED